MAGNQCTIKNAIECSGTGVHSGDIIAMKMLPAEEGTGIAFIRSDIEENNIIPALFKNVVDTKMCTVIANEHGISVATIEHLMSALWGCEIDNIIIELNGGEVPVMDGSSIFFVELIKSAGIKRQSMQRKILKILKAVHVVDKDKSIMIEPDDDFSVDFTIDFANKYIGNQSYKFTESQDFADNIGKARTFGFIEDLDYLRTKGLAKGASLENAVAVGSDGVLNEGGLRYHDEFVRHKILDCVGDLYLAGAHIKGKVRALKAGHTLNNLLLRKVFDTEGAYKLA